MNKTLHRLQLAPVPPRGLQDFTAAVVPILRRRGLFREEYEGPTLRDNLGLTRPENRFAARRRISAAE